MLVQSPAFKQFNILATPVQNNSSDDIKTLVSQIGKQTQLPNETRNYAILNQELVKKIVAKGESAVKPLTDFLATTNDEKQVTEGLYILDRMIDSGVKEIYKTYPVISRFNYTDSPNIQVMLAGVYRKTQVPDAFGPLMTMFWKNAQTPATKPFDPNEEIGGAILEYLRNKTSVNNYAKTQKIK